MTRRSVYITGDVGNCLDCHIYDYATQIKLDIVSINVDVRAGARSMAEMTWPTNAGGHTETVEVVPRPKHKDAGKEAVILSIATHVDPGRSSMTFEATAMVHVVEDDGRLNNNPLALVSKRTWTDEEIMRAPKTIRTDTVRLVTDELLATINKRMRTVQTTNIIKHGHKMVCDECGGTGEVVLFNGTEPCSKGCAKP